MLQLTCADVPVSTRKEFQYPELRAVSSGMCRCTHIHAIRSKVLFQFGCALAESLDRVALSSVL